MSDLEKQFKEVYANKNFEDFKEFLTEDNFKKLNKSDEMIICLKYLAKNHEEDKLKYLFKLLVKNNVTQPINFDFLNMNDSLSQFNYKKDINDFSTSFKSPFDSVNIRDIFHQPDFNNTLLPKDSNMAFELLKKTIEISQLDVVKTLYSFCEKNSLLSVEQKDSLKDIISKSEDIKSYITEKLDTQDINNDSHSVSPPKFKKF